MTDTQKALDAAMPKEVFGYDYRDGNKIKFVYDGVRIAGATRYIRADLAALEAKAVDAELLEALKYAHSMMQPFCDDTIVKQAITRAEAERG